MPTLIACPICNYPFTVAEATLGKTASCPGCGVRFTAKVGKLELDDSVGEDQEIDQPAAHQETGIVTVGDLLFDSSAAHNLQELEAILTRRYEGSRNTFWVSHGSEEYPTLGLFVKDDLACLFYLPGEGDAGFCSQGLIKDSLPGEKIAFFTSRDGEEMNVLNEFVVSWSNALDAAREFFSSSDLPQSIEWFQL